MCKKFISRVDGLDFVSFMNGLVFFAPVALLVRTLAGVTVSQFLLLQAVLSLTILLLEIPAGILTDGIGCRNTIILSQCTLLLARILLFVAFWQHNLVLFLVEVIIEGISACFSSGTTSAYIYSVYTEEHYLEKYAWTSNWGTAGFVISTISYALIYRVYDIPGLLIATIVANIIGAGCSLFLKQDIVTESKQTDTEQAENGGKSILKALQNKNVTFIILLTSILSIAGLLCDFFFVDKLQNCGIDIALLTPIILGGSLIQMFAAKIMDWTKGSRIHIALAVSLVVSGVGMILFGMANAAVQVVILMLLLPLLLCVPEYFLSELQNKVIDGAGQQKKRATLLSIFNMGVNLMEVIFLFFSSYCANVGVALCFAVLGGMMLAMCACTVLLNCLKH